MGDEGAVLVERLRRDRRKACDELAIEKLGAEIFVLTVILRDLMTFAAARHAAPTRSVDRPAHLLCVGGHHAVDDLAEIGVERARESMRAVEGESDLPGLHA